MSETILVHLNGRDHPGITAGLMALLAGADAQVLDVEQISLRERLHLSVVITVPAGHDLLKELLLFGWQRGLHLDFEIVETSKPGGTRDRPWFAVTLLGSDLSAVHLGSAAEAIASGGGNIERITCLARYPVTSYELLVSADNIAPIRANLVEAAHSASFDVAVQRDGLSRRALRLVALDVDSTLIQDEVIELLAAKAGVLDQVETITHRAMAGELDFTESLIERVRLLEGLEIAAVIAATTEIRLTPGARTFIRTLQRLGFTTAIVSGGFTHFTDVLRKELNVDYAFANELEIVDGKLTGKVTGRIVDRAEKAVILAEVAAAEGIDMAQTVAVGDGANDLDMLASAGLGIAFNSKPIVQRAADTAVTVPYLDAILFVLGIRRGDVEEFDVDAADGEMTRPAVRPV